MKNIICLESEFISDVKEKHYQFICFGTGVLAKELMQHACVKESMVMFADNDSQKHGKNFAVNGKTYPVISPACIPSYIFADSAIIIASSHFKTIIEQLEEIIGLSDIPCYNYTLIRINASADSDEFFERRLVNEAVNEYSSILTERGIVDESVKQKLLNEKAAFMRSRLPGGNHPVVIPRIMIMPSTKCNLRCKGCSSLFPYFTKPSDISIEQLKSDLSVFFGAIDECVRLTIGGEPFLYPHLSELLQFLFEIQNLYGIMMFTNSTIMPKEELLPLLQNEKIFFHISDYGHIEKMSRLAALFESKGIAFDVLSGQDWTDMGGTELRNKDAKTLRYQYLNCDQGRLIKAIFDGNVYICARSARMHALGVYSCENDRITLGASDSKEEIRAKLQKLYYAESADACAYCDLGSFPSKIIPAGVQMNGNFKQSEWTLVRRSEYNRLKKSEELQ
ncbi:MAG: hypothetical protein Ta2B_26500 [Termitinemataceae bacterium]|nr:MAG: hypothetical protein Ta2B_26500 [Termitinemataceae bacterium]